MADFGLAAQIGRGGGNAMAQPVDPMNRMTQMMQLQNLQQNMMLAQELAGRQREMQPLLMEEKRADIRGTTARGNVATEEAQIARLRREEAERTLRVNRGMIDVMDRADRGVLDLSSPEGLNAISDPEVRMAARRQLAEIREAASKAEKANLDRVAVQRAAAYQFVDRFGDGITGPRQYSSARSKILSVDPTAAEFLPDNYNMDNAERLRSFVRDRKTSIQMVNGVPVMVTEGSPLATELTIQRAPPPPAASAFGSVPSFQPSPMASDISTPAIAGTPSDMSAMPGIIGQRLPPASESRVNPAARAATLPASQFVSERQETPKPLTIQQERKLRNDIADDFKSATSTIDQMQGVLSAAKEVTNLPASVKDSITGWSGYVPSFREDTRSGDVALNNLKGKVTQLGRQAASLSGAIGSMAVQEWKIVSDMIASLDEKGMNPRDLDRQMALIEAQAQGTMNRIRDAYQRQYAEEFERFGDRFKLPESRQAGAAAATSGPPAVGAVDSGYRFKGGDPSKPSSWEKI